MARRFEERITVNAPADKVFEYVSDFTRHSEWSGHRLEAKQEGVGAVSVGTVFATTAHQFGTQREKSTITEMTRGAMFAWESTGALGRVRHWFAMREEGGGTELTKGIDLLKPTFLAKMFSWRFNKEGPRNLRADLEKIRAAVEGSA
jgi:uncharacterized membrane protein